MAVAVLERGQYIIANPAITGPVYYVLEGDSQLAKYAHDNTEQDTDGAVLSGGRDVGDETVVATGVTARCLEPDVVECRLVSDNAKTRSFNEVVFLSQAVLKAGDLTAAPSIPFGS